MSRLLGLVGSPSLSLLSSSFFSASSAQFGFPLVRSLSSSSSPTPSLTTSSSLPNRKKVVIIGGGVIGCSVAYHLAHLGWGEHTLLLERNSLTSGTTWHAAGLIGQLRGSEEETRLSKYGVELYKALEEETGHPTGFREVGSLTLARNEDRMHFLRVAAARAESFAIANEILSPDEVKEKYPLIRTDDIVGALWLPGDGTANASDCAMSLSVGAKRRGVQIVQGMEVSEVITHTPPGTTDRRVTGVVVKSRGGDTHTIECDFVINTSGQWARDVAAQVSVKVPLYSCQHYYVVTRPISANVLEDWNPGVSRHPMIQPGGVSPYLPVLRDPDGYLYIREWSGGLLIGCFEPNALPAFPPSAPIPRDTEFHLFDFDWDHFDLPMREAIHRFPFLDKVEIRDTVNGAESFTADNRYILGESPQLKGFFTAAGFNSSGIASAPGAGRALAHWIVHGKPERDLWTVDIKRFSDFHCNSNFLRDRAVESLGLHYAIQWPRMESRTARNVRKSPLYSALADKGAVFGNSNGWERALFFDKKAKSLDYSFLRPSWLDTVKEEHIHTRTHVSIFDQSSFSKYLIQGKGAESFLEFCCGNVIRGPVGRVTYTAMLNVEGGIESDVTVTKLDEESFMMVGGSAQTTRDLDWLTNAKRKLGADVVITDYTSALSVLGVMGPLSRRLMSLVDPKTDFSHKKFAPFRSLPISLGYATGRASRVSYVGELGWELYVPSEMTTSAYEHLHEVGEREGISVRDAGYYSIDSLRIEKGYVAWGKDMNANNNPFEMGIDFAVKIDSEIDFEGKSALKEIRKSLPRRLLSFVFDDVDVYPIGGECIFRDGDLVGYVSSAAWCASVGSAVAMGIVSLPPSVSLHPSSLTQEEVGKGKWRIRTLQGEMKVRAVLGPAYKSPPSPK